MKKTLNIATANISKGSAIFSKILEEKKAIREHIQKGGDINNLKDKYRFVKPLSIGRK
jgi:hypothetical protein